jgi:hypothetical protein
MDDEQLSALEEELRRDLEALTRVRGMMASKGAAVLKRPEDQQLIKLRPITAAPVKAANDDEDEGSYDLDATSLRGVIFRVISAEPNLRWTTQKVFAKLQSEKYPFQAQKPLISVGQALKALSKQEKIRVIRRGTGSAPNIYKGLEKHDSDGISTTERTLAG